MTGRPVPERVFAHAPVLGPEAMDALAIRSEGTYVDATFGCGGHSRMLLERLGPQGRVVAIDRDPEAIAVARGMDDPRFVCVQGCLSGIAQVLEELAVVAVDGVLMDLGVSSPQLDDPARGFSFRREGPLDMRMDPGSGESAAEWLARAQEQEIAEVIWRYGEERFAQQIARAVVAARAREPLRTTRQLATLVAGAVRSREPSQDPATRTFQALRIHVNQELAELEIALPAACGRLAAGGRLVVISFHSLEDRIVKRFMRDMSSPPRLPRDLPVKAADIPAPSMRMVGKPVRAGDAEVSANPRSRSAILRTLEKR